MKSTEKLLIERAQKVQDSGDYLQAAALYRELIAEYPDNIEAIHHLALLLLEMNLSEEAIPLLSRAVELAPKNAALYYNLGFAYQNINEIKAAIHSYKTSIQINPNFTQAYNNIGVAYQHLGNIELANSYLERAFQVDPHYVEAYYNFSQTHKFTQSDDRLINTIHDLNNNKKLPKQALIKLGFTLGKIFDDLGDYKTAFNYYQQANTLKFKSFNSSKLDEYIDKIMNTYNIQLIEKLSPHYHASNKRFIFIIGMPRSGTTLVEQIISSHPLVQSGGEIGFIGEVIDELPALIDTQIPYPECIELFSSQQISQITSKFNAYLQNIGSNFLHITDKSPVNFLHLGLIKILFPQSLIVHVKRNPIATCLSCYFQNFDKQHQYSYDLTALARFYGSYSRVMSYWQELFENNFVSVNYEELIKSPKQEMQNLIENCGLQWDKTCVEYYNNENVINSASKWQSRQPIYSNSVEKWKNYESYISPLLSL